MTRREKSLFLFLAFILLLVFVLSLSGCSDRVRATKHIRKAEKHLKKAEALGAKVEADTVYKSIPIFIPQVRKDTVFQSVPGDTVRIEKDRLRIRYVDLPGDSVYIYGESKADTVYKNVPVIVKQDINCPPKDNKWMWIAIGLGVVLILGLVLRRL